MSKIHLDKYYTPQSLADYCTKKTVEIIGIDNVTELVESSAGQGVFLNSFDKFLPNTPYKAYDIEPEDDRIVKQNYLELETEYKIGRVVGFNFPYGKGNYLAVQFYKKSLEFGDYICSILPISQLNNNMYMYEFDLIHSEDLKPQKYSNVKVHCCFNIYKRNINGYNSKPNYDLKDITLKGVSTGVSRNDKVPEIYDFSIFGFGASVGKFCDYESQYCQQIYFNINNYKHKDKITNLIKNVKWKELYSMTATPKLKHWQILKYLKQQIPEIQ